MSRTWFVQANPKLYDIDAALRSRPVIYWRTRARRPDDPEMAAKLRIEERELEAGGLN
jgi:hypothetical protein